jgi:tetratricopeptide (TPR) repeat protein
MDRARTFFELGLAGVPTEETLGLLEELAAAGDKATGGERLRRSLCQALTTSGGGARDGGRTRASLLRRAATIVHRDLKDVDQAFSWMGDALVAYVDPSTLDGLEGLADSVGDPRRAESAISHALGEVFDGPLVRQLLARRAKLRLEKLNDQPGAAADLKKLHDLSPTDTAVLEQLSGLLGELGDYRGMVQLYEDQILRGKDVSTRAELARKVARMWEEQLADPREAADAWRRVLRMKPGDPEATSGLERAKSNMLKKPDPDAGPEAYAPPKMPPPSQAPQSMPTPVPSPIPPAIARQDTGPNTGQFVAALTTDTSETPVESPDSAEEPSTDTGPPGARDTSQSVLMVPMPSPSADPAMNPPASPDDSARIDLSDVDLIVEDSATDLGASANAERDNLSTTAERGGLDFDDNEHTEYRPFVPPPDPAPTGPGDGDVVDVDDEAEEVDDDR